MSRSFGLILATSMVATSLPAQQMPNLDRSTMEALQRQLGGSGMRGGALDALEDLGASRRDGLTPDLDPLDQSRERGDGGMSGFGALGGGDTPAETELRELRARSQLSLLYQPSRIEKVYRERTGDPALRQFGYELFRATQGITGQVTGAVGDNYVLGVGDEVVVNFQGATTEVRTVRVNREGQIIVAGLPPVRAAGRSLGAVRGQLQDQTRQTMLGTNVYASVGSVRSITVFVGGEVNRPGQFSMTSLADVASALAQAEGVRRTGSLRRVRIVRGGRTVSVDLYGLLGIGAPPSTRLQDGDRIIVPAIGDTVAVTGGVTRPGIYELRNETSISTVVEYAGGPMRARGSRVTISRIGADGVERFVPVSGIAQTVQPNDVLQVATASSGVADRVQLRGNIDTPGPRPLQAASTVRELIGNIGDLRPDTYLPFAVLQRRNALTGSFVYEGVNLATALTSTPVSLRSEDTLWLFSRDDIDFINSFEVAEAALGRVPTLQCRSLQAFLKTVKTSQQVRFNVLTRGSFLVEENGELQVVSPGGRLQNLSARSLGKRTAVQSEERDAQNLQGMAAPANGAAAPQRLGINEYMEGFDRRRCPALFEEQPELLAVTVEHAMAVGGAVRRPGAYPIAGSIDADAAAAIAGGMIAGSRDIVMDVNRGSATATHERYALDNAGAALTRISLRSGDDLRFNAAQPQFESGAVLLTGEFARPGLYVINKGETLSSLMARAGGLTPLAYPYGAVFTRQSVKELQQAGFERTARELATGLLAVSARKNLSGEAMAGAISVIDQVTQTEAAGRVVIEADPTVLAQRADLDTVLDAGDSIYMPKRPNFVLVLGDVNNPGAVQFTSGDSAKKYMAAAGGIQRTGDDDHIYVVMPNGLAQPVKSSVWRRTAFAIPPGSTIIVPKNLDPLMTLDLVRDITSIVGSLVTSVATVAILADRN
jgi:protein involved in polysaccharide export with SLBB domain